MYVHSYISVCRIMQLRCVCETQSIFRLRSPSYKHVNKAQWYYVIIMQISKSTFSVSFDARTCILCRPTYIQMYIYTVFVRYTSEYVCSICRQVGMCENGRSCEKDPGKWTLPFVRCVYICIQAISEAGVYINYTLFKCALAKLQYEICITYKYSVCSADLVCSVLHLLVHTYSCNCIRTKYVCYYLTVMVMCVLFFR